MMRDYPEYLTRDQHGEARQTLDLLRGWGSAGRESFRSRLGRRLVALGNALQGTERVRQSAPASPVHCGMQ